jgi:hypothetical protein
MHLQDRIMPHETIQPQYLVTYSPAAQYKWLKQEVGSKGKGRRCAGNPSVHTATYL